ncbi:MAG: DUF1150 family protein [Hyphomicrobiaceae bacterium]
MTDTHGSQKTKLTIDSSSGVMMTDEEFAELGDGQWAYIKSLTSEEALEAYPSIEELPKGINIYALHAADGSPIALTDDKGVAIEQAMGEELEIASLH